MGGRICRRTSAFLILPVGSIPAGILFRSDEGPGCKMHFRNAFIEANSSSDFPLFEIVKILASRLNSNEKPLNNFETCRVSDSSDHRDPGIRQISRNETRDVRCLQRPACVPY